MTEAHAERLDEVLNDIIIEKAKEFEYDDLIEEAVDNANIGDQIDKAIENALDEYDFERAIEQSVDLDTEAAKAVDKVLDEVDIPERVRTAFLGLLDDPEVLEKLTKALFERG